MANEQQSTIAMDSETANHLFHEGGTLVFLGVPRGTEFGIDYNTWKVDSNFKGIKMIPPGIHFIYYSAVSKHNEVAPRTGFFYNFKQREVLIKKWDPRTEDIKSDIITEEEQTQVVGNKQEMDRFLGAYPYDSYKKWVSLTNQLASDVVDRLHPLNQKIASVAELQSEMSTTESRKEAAENRMNTDQPEVDSDRDPDDPRLPRMHSAPDTMIRFTPIPKKKYPDGATPTDMTKYSLDHSYVLQTLLDTVYKDNELGVLGEVQFAFICFLLGQVFDAFEQWKQLVHLLCCSEEAIRTHPVLYTQFISILHYHIREIPEDFFVDIVTRDNFLVSTLRTFFANLDNSDCKRELKVRGEKFKDNLQKRFKWDFTVEDDEDGPVVVELPCP